ncbi:hypothetical protein GCM10011617_28050 [Novosphingobium arvoryzae]|uniref:Uncharacterized protein n=1 Tax=Novosphingobium arvoryzae TaxID=1256514 RepID=A0A918VK55_9SPHN|nr:hypothetical protein GCM10011617_28050 [Novosphingobium arvoryzae]
MCLLFSVGLSGWCGRSFHGCSVWEQPFSGAPTAYSPDDRSIRGVTGGAKQRSQFEPQHMAEWTLQSSGISARAGISKLEARYPISWTRISFTFVRKGAMAKGLHH